MKFIDKLNKSWNESNSLLCVGLDPDYEKLPEILKSSKDPIFEFNKAIIDATHDLVCAFKPQFAHYSAFGDEEQLVKTINYIKKNYPNKPIILDSKRGDIGSTAEKYAKEAFERYQVDAVTVNPYMGSDSIEPFNSYSEKGVVILCRTSNDGAEDIQDLMIGDTPLYLKVAELIRDKWNKNANCLAVVGATWPNQMKLIRETLVDVPFLVPGVGAQGGDVESIIKYGQTKDGNGLIISSSRAVLYASSGDDFAEASRKVASELKDEINGYR